MSPPLSSSVLLGLSALIAITYFLARRGKSRIENKVCNILFVPSHADAEKFKSNILTKYRGAPAKDDSAAKNEAAEAVATAAASWAGRVAATAPEKASVDALAQSVRAAIDFYKSAVSSAEANSQKLDVQRGDRLMSYVERIIDRQINKARGILTFDGIMIVAVRYYDTPPATPPNVAYVLSTQALWIAILLCLFLCWVHWGKPDRKPDFETEFEDSAALIRNRSILVQWAVYLSVGSVVVEARQESTRAVSA
jgi:hypothetical protein